MSSALNLPNIVSLLRIPLALLLVFPSVTIRLTALGVALLTDGLDGYLARRYHLQTKLGAILDPLTDKFFVLVALIVCYTEAMMAPWQVVAFFARDIALFFITIRAFFVGPLLSHPVRSVMAGKVTTVLQFVTLTLLVMGIKPPLFIWISFFILGLAFFAELLRIKRDNNVL